MSTEREYEHITRVYVSVVLELSAKIRNLMQIFKRFAIICRVDDESTPAHSMKNWQFVISVRVPNVIYS